MKNEPHDNGPASPAARARLGKDEVNALPLFRYGGKISLVRTDADAAYALSRLGRPSVLGFDTETRPSFFRGVSYLPSLVQLALEDEVFLFHFKWRPLGPDLLSLFENPAVIKTGVAVHDDMRFLCAVRPFRPASVIDLGEVARLNNIENRGLRGLAALFLGLRVSKTEHCSNWGHGELSPRQISYAATDAWVSLALYLKMREAGLDFSGEENREERTPPDDNERRRRRVRARRVVRVSLSGTRKPENPEP
ncbi:MAG: 3'-5' exonuclease domain-containing protein 2 [Desulfovibrio sp.]|jgi:ribonuclease D|nr:3'-5' exonuclease domain-containing protein 2 [Desulfovibrio sp.]